MLILGGLFSLFWDRTVEIQTQPYDVWVACLTKWAIAVPPRCWFFFFEVHDMIKKRTSINKNLKLKCFLFIYFQLAHSCNFFSVLHIFFFSFRLCFPHSSEWSTEECAFNESIPSVRTSSITHSEVCGLFRVTGTCSCWICGLLWDFLHD